MLLTNNKKRIIFHCCPKTKEKSNLSVSLLFLHILTLTSFRYLLYMAIAAFKSSSRRGNQSQTQSNSTPSNTPSSSSGRPSREQSRNKAPIRRSRSVSAFSRGNLDISTEFLNKRDNPLFWSTSTSPPRDDETTQPAKSLLLETSDSDKTAAPARDPNKGRPSPADSRSASGSARGRHVTRNGEAKGSSTTGRSLSRVDTGRRTRSASQCPASRRRWNYSTSEVTLIDITLVVHL